MKPFRLGLDLDGVFANFNRPADDTITELTGRRLSPKPWRTPTVWLWMKAYGYRRSEENAFWDHVNTQPDWWLSLPTLPGAQAVLDYIQGLVERRRVEVYFLTTRPATSAHWQSSQWLQDRGIGHPQVVICDNHAHKGQIARALRLGGFVDDHGPNIQAVWEHAPQTRLCLFEAPYNVDEREPLTKIGAYLAPDHDRLREILELWLEGQD